MDADRASVGHGVLVWFEVDDYGAAAARVRALGAHVVEERLNANAHPRELWLRDAVGYVVSSPRPAPHARTSSSARRASRRKIAGTKNSDKMVDEVRPPTTANARG